VRSGDVVGLGPLVITASPAGYGAGDAVGYHVALATGAVDAFARRGDGAGGPALWHTGPLPPLDVAVDAGGFAVDHRADVVLGAGPVVGWRVGGPPFVAPLDDVLLLARRARARAVVPLGGDVDVAIAMQGVLARRASAPGRPSFASAPLASSGGPRVIDAAAGTWLRWTTAPRG